MSLNSVLNSTAMHRLVEPRCICDPNVRAPDARILRPASGKVYEFINGSCLIHWRSS